MPPILSISSHVVADPVGQSITSFAFQRLGHEVWALPTVLSLKPSVGVLRGGVVPQEIFDSIVAGLLQMDLSSLAGLHIGYLRTPEQVRAAARVVDAVRAAAPGTTVLVDPVLGDAPAGLYIPPETAVAVKTELAACADIVTPNLFELGFLTGGAPATQEAALAALQSLPSKIALCTSAPASEPERIATLVVEEGRGWRVESPRLETAPNGTGDLLAALFLARLLRGEGAPAALAAAVSSVHDLIAASQGGSHAILPAIERQARLEAPQSRFTAEVLTI